MEKNTSTPQVDPQVAEHIKKDLVLLTRFVRDPKVGFVLTEKGLFNVERGETITDPEKIHLTLAHTYFMAGYDAASEMIVKYAAEAIAQKKSAKQ